MGKGIFMMNHFYNSVAVTSDLEKILMKTIRSTRFVSVSKESSREFILSQGSLVLTAVFYPLLGFYRPEYELGNKRPLLFLPNYGISSKFRET